MWQENILDQLLSPFTLERLHDSELKVPDDKDAFHFRRVDKPADKRRVF